MKNYKSKNLEKTIPDKYFDLARSNRFLKKIISLLFLINLLLILGVVKSVSSNKIQTLIIERNSDGYKLLGNANEIAIEQKKISDAEIIRDLYMFVENTKMLTNDIELYKKQINKASFFMTENSKNKFELYLKEDNYEEIIRKKNKVETIFTTGVKLSENTYQLRWLLRITNSKGEIVDERKQMAVFTVKYDSFIESQEAAIFNPLGLKITEYIQSEELN